MPRKDLLIPRKLMDLGFREQLPALDLDAGDDVPFGRITHVHQPAAPGVISDHFVVDLGDRSYLESQLLANLATDGVFGSSISFILVPTTARILPEWLFALFPNVLD